MATFSDNFDRADAPIGADWGVLSGTWNIVTNRARAAAGGVEVVQVAKSVFLVDQSAEVKCFGAAPGNFGVILRRQPAADTYYMAQLTRDAGVDLKTKLWKVVAGVFTQLAEVLDSWVSGDTIKADVTGSTITVFRNGVLKLTVVNADIPGVGRPGIFSQQLNNDFDDYVATGMVVEGLPNLAVATAVLGNKGLWLGPRVGL